MVLVPNEKGGYRDIVLVEVMWKVVAVILNHRLIASITYHNFLNGFRSGCGTGTTTLEAKLLQKLAALRKKVLYMIFLDLQKAYDALDRSRCLEILEGYGMVPRSFCLLQTYWGWLRMIAKAGGCYWLEFQVSRDVTQGGGGVSPTIFNVVLDVVV